VSKPQGRDWHAAVTLLTGLAIVRAIVRIVCVDPPKKPDLALLRVNRLVGAEAHHRFYNSACFYINEYQLLGDDCESNGLDQFLVPDW
jgi:hypothetical protein